MTKTEIIEETAAFYNSDNRSTWTDEEGDTSCKYLGPDGKRCAFSRCCKDSEEAMEILGKYEGLAADEIGDREAILKDEYSGHNSFFWVDLQEFHDNEANWDVNGLTANGLINKNALLEQWAE